jgi:hypothetical protein
VVVAARSMSTESGEKRSHRERRAGGKPGDKVVARAQLTIEQALNEIEQAFLSKSVTVPIFLNRLRSMRAMFNGTWHRIAYVLVGWNPKTNQREEPGIK